MWSNKNNLSRTFIILCCWNNWRAQAETVVDPQCCDVIAPALTTTDAASAASPLAGRAQRWAVFGEPYQQRLVSAIPGTWSPYQPSSLPSWSPQQNGPPALSSFQELQQPPYQPLDQQPYPWPPLAPYLSQQNSPLPVTVDQQQSPSIWPSTTYQDRSITPMWPGYGPYNPFSNAPRVPWQPFLSSSVSDPNELASKDLDVGVYAGADSPWTQLPPFSRTIPGFAPRATLPNWYTQQQQASKDLDVGVFAGDNRFPLSPVNPPITWHPNTWSGLPTWLNYPVAAPFSPWMKQLGGFSVRPADRDVKLTMHVPQDGLPGGVLVMEMKASVFRPVM